MLTRKVKSRLNKVNNEYQFGRHQMLVGHFIAKYYDTPINEFRLTDTKHNWPVISYCEVQGL